MIESSSHLSPSSTNHMIIWLILWFIICIPLIPLSLTFHQLLDLSSWHVKHQCNINITVDEHKGARDTSGWVFCLFLFVFCFFFTGFLLLVDECMEWRQMVTTIHTSHHYQCRANMTQQHEWPQRDRGKGGHGRGLKTCCIEPGVFFSFFFFFSLLIYICCVLPSHHHFCTTTAGLEMLQTCLELWIFFPLNKKPLLMLVFTYRLCLRLPHNHLSTQQQ